VRDHARAPFISQIITLPDRSVNDWLFEKSTNGSNARLTIRREDKKPEIIAARFEPIWRANLPM
jgi:hypothetical protein